MVWNKLLIGLSWWVFMRSFFLHLNIRCFCVDSKTTSNYSGIGASKNSSVPSAQILVMQFKITLMQCIESGLWDKRFWSRKKFLGVVWLWVTGQPSPLNGSMRAGAVLGSLAALLLTLYVLPPVLVLFAIAQKQAAQQKYSWMAGKVSCFFFPSLKKILSHIGYTQAGFRVIIRKHCNNLLQSSFARAKPGFESWKKNKSHAEFASMLEKNKQKTSWKT